MLKIIGLVILVLVIGVIVYYFGFYKRGKINDKDGDLIPDGVEEVVRETKRRAKAVKKEIKDVAKSTKEVINQVGDVVDAAKGKKRRG